MKINDSPCKDCPDRHFGCHSECDSYSEFRKERDLAIKKRLEEYVKYPVKYKHCYNRKKHYLGKV